MAFLSSFGKSVLRSFGALSQDSEDEVEDKPQRKVMINAHANDIESETTSISRKDFQQLHRRLSILQSSSKSNIRPEECQPMAQNSSENSDKARQDDGRVPDDSPKRKMKTPVANARRWCCFTKIFSE
jgi:hypothetical protein